MRWALIIFLFFLLGCMTTGYGTQSKQVAYQIKKNPDAYRGKLVAFEGRVISAREAQGITTLQMLVLNNPHTDIDGPSAIILFGGSVPVFEQDNIKVLGRVLGSSTGTNMFGAPVTSVTIEGMAVQKSFTTYTNPEHAATIEKWEKGELFGKGFW